jgi:hypothetical protein
MTAATIRHALWMAHQPPQWAYLDEVANATGWAGNRYIDGVAMGLWVSLGLEIHGFEIKISKSDWARELSHPNKAEVATRDLDRFWVVAPAGVVDPKSVPQTWGLKVYNPETGNLRTAIKAPRLPHRRVDEQMIPRSLVASLLRRATETMVPKDMVEQAAQQRAVDIAKDRSNEIALECEVRALKDRLEMREGADDRLREIARMLPDSQWGLSSFIRAAKLVQKLQTPGIFDHLIKALDDAAAARTKLSHAMQLLKEAPDVEPNQSPGSPAPEGIS